MNAWLSRLMLGTGCIIACLAVVYKLNFQNTLMIFFQKQYELSPVVKNLGQAFKECPAYQRIAAIALVIASIVIFFSLVAHRVLVYQREKAIEQNVGALYCTNKMTEEEFNDMTYTRKAVMELINSAEYRHMIKQRSEERMQHGTRLNNG